jgi:hypothetical protein
MGQLLENLELNNEQMIPVSGVPPSRRTQQLRLSSACLKSIDRLRARRRFRTKCVNDTEPRYLYQKMSRLPCRNYATMLMAFYLTRLASFLNE